MADFKWQKEMNAWAEGKRVQIRYFSPQSGKLLLDWHDIEDTHAWIRTDVPTTEYRVYELEVEKYYKVRFKGLTDDQFVVAFLSTNGCLRWHNSNGSCSTSINSKSLKEIRPEDKVC